MRLFRSLITGGELTDLEKALGDGLRVFRRRALADVSSARQRSIFVSLALNEHPLDQIQVGLNYPPQRQVATFPQAALSHQPHQSRLSSLMSIYTDK